MFKRIKITDGFGFDNRVARNIKIISSAAPVRVLATDGDGVVVLDSEMRAPHGTDFEGLSARVEFYSDTDQTIEVWLGKKPLDFTQVVPVGGSTMVTATKFVGGGRTLLTEAKLRTKLKIKTDKAIQVGSIDVNGNSWTVEPGVIPEELETTGAVYAWRQRAILNPGTHQHDAALGDIQNGTTWSGMVACEVVSGLAMVQVNNYTSSIVMRHSTDDGATFQDTPLPPLGDGGGFHICAYRGDIYACRVLYVTVGVRQFQVYKWMESAFVLQSSVPWDGQALPNAEHPVMGYLSTVFDDGTVYSLDNNKNLLQFDLVSGDNKKIIYDKSTIASGGAAWLVDKDHLASATRSDSGGFKIVNINSGAIVVNNASVKDAYASDVKSGPVFGRSITTNRPQLSLDGGYTWVEISTTSLSVPASLGRSVRWANGFFVYINSGKSMYAIDPYAMAGNQLQLMNTYGAEIGLPGLVSEVIGSHIYTAEGFANGNKLQRSVFGKIGETDKAKVNLLEFVV